jgi:dTDP-4-amino-4,6-dideoxygalactose transaminase
MMQNEYYIYFTNIILKMINVTKSYLPPLNEYVKHLEGIWERGHLTNHGPLVLELEERIKEFLGVKHFFFVNNGTIALQIAIKAANLKGDVITTPFSYVATTSSLIWEGCNPVFGDVLEDQLTLDPRSAEQMLTPGTTGILATHVYGNPCNVEEIENIARPKGIKVIYDAAHAFGVEYKGRSILNYGDISTLSFHATKIFHTIEGGGLVTEDDDLAHRISYMRNFGHNGPDKFFGVGVNGKSSEFQAAMGLCLLPKMPEIIRIRKSICHRYKENLESLPLKFLEIQEGTTRYNFAYFPIIFRTENELLKVLNEFINKDIHPRRYFYPSLNTLNFVDNNLRESISESMSSRILCLPLYPELSLEAVDMISKIIKENLI